MAKPLQKHTAVILAAGRGSRLMPHTKNKPKCLVNIGGRPILFYQLRALEMAGLTRVTIVTGYLAELIKRYVKNHFSHLDVHFINNDRYNITDDIYSIYLAKIAHAGNIIHLNSDVLFHPAIFSLLLKCKTSTICVRRAVCGEEEMKIRAGKNNTVTMIGKTISSEGAMGEGIGIYLFSNVFSRCLLSVITKAIFSANARGDRGSMIGQVITGGLPLSYIDVTSYPAIEIDFPDDLKKAEEEILPQIISEYRLPVIEF